MDHQTCANAGICVVPTVYRLFWTVPQIAYVGATYDFDRRLAAHLNQREKVTAGTVRDYDRPDQIKTFETDDENTQKIELRLARELRQSGWNVLNAPRGGWAPYLGAKGSADKLGKLHEEKLPDGRSKHAVWVGQTYGRKAALAAAQRRREDGPTKAQIKGQFEGGKRGGVTTSKRRRKCGGCDLVTVPGNITRHQTRTGHTGYTEMPSVD